MSFAEYQTEDRRLVILRTLADDQGYSLNDSMIHTFVDSVGHTVSRDTIRADFAWLEEQHLITVTNVSGILVATLLERGADVGKGRAAHPGVKRPAPKKG